MKTVTASEAAATGLVTGGPIAPGSGDASNPNAQGANAATSAPKPTGAAAEKLELAKKLASKINLKNNPKGASQQVCTKITKIHITGALPYFPGFF